MTNLSWVLEIAANLSLICVTCALCCWHVVLGKALNAQSTVNRLLAQGYDGHSQQLQGLADRLARLEAGDD